MADDLKKAGGFGDLTSGARQSKRIEEADKPARVSNKTQGAPLKGKTAIRSRTISLEEEYVEFMEILVKRLPDLSLSRSDVVRVALVALSKMKAEKLKSVIEQNRLTTSNEVGLRITELEREFDKAEREELLKTITPEELERLIDRS
ncbi:hypothetical protein K5C76_21085 [Klebsiella pneumoniae]|uniref:hypothetical protein n=1 Tax=Klebsiella pneumoniae TaxID=573 RepID=UPI00355B11B1|nr:hypothetical protein [Klebsiella pneumoniae]